MYIQLKYSNSILYLFHLASFLVKIILYKPNNILLAHALLLRKTYSFASHILLYDTGCDFVAKRINLNTEEQNYLTVNSKGRVPVPMTSDGVFG